MAAPPHIARENGKKGGRPPGRKNDKTLVLEAEHEAFQQMVLQNLRPLLDAQLNLAKGVTHIYRVSYGPRGGQRDPELVTDPDELHEAIAALQAGAEYSEIRGEEGEDGEAETRRYYFLTTKTPDGRSIDSLIDRIFGKSVQRIAGGDGGPIQIQGVEISVRSKRK